jgi:hypothetical protein
MRMMVPVALATAVLVAPVRAGDETYVTVHGRIMCTTQEMLRQALQAVRDKNREQLRTVQGCRQSLDGIPAELLQDNVSMIKVRVGYPDSQTEYWTLPETIKPTTRR